MTVPTCWVLFASEVPSTGHYDSIGLVTDLTRNCRLRGPDQGGGKRRVVRNELALGRMYAGRGLTSQMTKLVGLLQRSYRVDRKLLPKCVFPKNGPLVSWIFSSVL